MAPHTTSQLKRTRTSMRRCAQHGSGSGHSIALCLWVLGLWAVALCALLASCADTPPEVGGAAVAPSDDAVAAALAAGFAVDTVGVRNLAEGDTLNLDTGLTIIETTVKFPERGEVFAWEFHAETLNPVKLVVVRWKDSRTRLELIGESPTAIPERLGSNKMQLPEPIPVQRRDMMGIYMQEAGTIPFRKITSWKSLIMPRALERPFTRRERFTMYGWRYGVRAFWRKPNEPTD